MMAFFGHHVSDAIACSVSGRTACSSTSRCRGDQRRIVGLGLAGATRRYQRELKPRDGFLLVTLSWVLMSGSARCR
jgi:hypothetical protein